MLLQDPNNESNSTDDEQAQKGICDFPKLDQWDKSIRDLIQRDQLQCNPNVTKLCKVC